MLIPEHACRGRAHTGCHLFAVPRPRAPLLTGRLPAPWLGRLSWCRRGRAPLRRGAAPPTPWRTPPMVYNPLRPGFRGGTRQKWTRGCSSVGERLPCKQEVGGSNPLISTRWMTWPGGLPLPARFLLARLGPKRGYIFFGLLFGLPKTILRPPKAADDAFHTSPACPFPACLATVEDQRRDPARACFLVIPAECPSLPRKAAR